MSKWAMIEAAIFAGLMAAGPAASLALSDHVVTNRELLLVAVIFLGSAVGKMSPRTIIGPQDK